MEKNENMEKNEKENVIEKKPEINPTNWSTNNLLNIVYFIIFICIAIWVFLYMKQNNVLNEEPKEEMIESWLLNSDIVPPTSEVITENDPVLETWVQIENSEQNTVTWTTEVEKTEKTEIEKKNEEAIIKDFEKELDSLFNVIESNAK